MNIEQFKQKLDKDNFGCMDAFVNESKQFALHANDKTGFDSIDKNGPFLPGLYVLGGMPGVGKTTFALQLANQLASMNRPILYFATIATNLELMSQLISHRINLQAKKDDTYHKYTATDIQFGQANNSREFKEQRENLVALGNNLIIVSCPVDFTIDDVVEFVNAYHKKSKKVPVVIVDFLQTLYAPSRVKEQTQSEIALDALRALKAVQRDANNVIVAISTLDCSYETSPLLPEAFNMPGDFIDIADVIWGFQFSVVTTRDFNIFKGVDGVMMDTTSSMKHIMLDEEKCKSVRDMDLVCLKNRFGMLYTAEFEYEPKYNTFLSKE